MTFQTSFGKVLKKHNLDVHGFNGTCTEEVAEGLGRRYLRLMQAWYGRELFWWRRMPCPVEMPSHWREACKNLGQDCTWFLGEADEWLTDVHRFVQDCAIGGTCVIQGFSGLAHEASLREGEELWKSLFSTL